jgi:hypothetical protein
MLNANGGEMPTSQFEKELREKQISDHTAGELSDCKFWHSKRIRRWRNKQARVLPLRPSKRVSG